MRSVHAAASPGGKAAQREHFVRCALPDRLGAEDEKPEKCSPGERQGRGHKTGAGRGRQGERARRDNRETLRWQQKSRESAAGSSGNYDERPVALLTPKKYRYSLLDDRWQPEAWVLSLSAQRAAAAKKARRRAHARKQSFSGGEINPRTPAQRYFLRADIGVHDWSAVLEALRCTTFTQNAINVCSRRMILLMGFRAGDQRFR